MFGVSFTKLLFTILAIVAIWRVFKLVQRWQERRDLARTGKPAGHSRPTASALDLEACPLCGTYVPRHGPRCRAPEDCLFAEIARPPAPRA